MSNETSYITEVIGSADFIHSGIHRIEATESTLLVSRPLFAMSFNIVPPATRRIAGLIIPDKDEIEAYGSPVSRDRIGDFQAPELPELFQKIKQIVQARAKGPTMCVVGIVSDDLRPEEHQALEQFDYEMTYDVPADTHLHTGQYL